MPDPQQPEPEFTIADVDDLTYGELAASLYAADIPLDGAPVPTIEETRRLVVQGVRRVGLARIRQLDQETRRLNLEMIARAQRDEDTSGWGSATRRLWPSARRMTVAFHLAHALLAHQAATPPAARRQARHTP